MKNKTQENEKKTIIPKQKKPAAGKKEKRPGTKKTCKKNQKQQHGSETGSNSCTDGCCDHGIKCD